MRQSIALSFIALAAAAHAQVRSSACIWGEDFQSGIPSGWVTNMVERQTPAGAGLGEFVPAFTAGTASDANSGGFFPVPDAPIGNRFAMANDDAAPCNCDLSEAVLETPSIDLSGSTAIALDLRVHHTRALGGGEAWIDFNANGGEWQPLELIPAGQGWQQLTYDLALLGGISDLRLRFRWSDDTAWASGFAIDDLCIREQLLHDLAVTAVSVGDASLSPFPSANNGLGYRLLPLEQSRAMAVSVLLHNVGSAKLFNIDVSVVARQNGVDHGPYASLLDSIAPGERATVVVQTDWVPDALGEVTYSATAQSTTGEEDADDNNGVAAMTMTGAGWDEGYGAMALDAGQVQGAFGSEGGFIAANRFEVVDAGSLARGLSAVLGTETQEGEFVRAILMDANFAFIDTSTRHAITAADIELAWGGGAIYLPFTLASTIGAGDYFAGLQRLGNEGRVSVALSGNCAPGAAAIMQGSSFDISWPTTIPMVRLHLNEYGVGVPAHNDKPTGELRVHPLPMRDIGHLSFRTNQAGAVRLSIRDASGRLVRETPLGFLASGDHVIPIEASDLSPGLYAMELVGREQRWQARVIVSP